MAYIWTIAPENKALLQRCITAAAPPVESNKWLRKFGPRNIDLINKTCETITVNDSPEIDESSVTQENQDESISNAEEEFLDPEIDLLTKFDHLVQQCRRTPTLLVKLAQKLPTSTTEKLFEYILNTDGLNREFLGAFYKYFLHHYIKREHSRFCTDVLLQTYNKYPQYLTIALKVILKDLEIQNNVVNDFILNLNAKNQTEFLEILSDFEFTTDEFSHNLFNIYTAYKTCNKNDSVQNYIFSCLKNYCDFCCSDKNFGKLMLAFLQHEKVLKRGVDFIVLGGIIERHKSPFKRPCMSVFKEIKDEE